MKIIKETTRTRFERLEMKRNNELATVIAMTTLVSTCLEPISSGLQTSRAMPKPKSYNKRPSGLTPEDHAQNEAITAKRAAKLAMKAEKRKGLK